jgi:hypothetical protein
MEPRLPAHIEVSALLRSTQAEGGFATVLKKGQAEAGTLMVVLTHNGTNTRAYERMPQADGSRQWTVSRVQDVENPNEFNEYLERRGKQDSDLWIVELDIANGEQLIGLKPYQT